MEERSYTEKTTFFLRKPHNKFFVHRFFIFFGNLPRDWGICIKERPWDGFSVWSMLHTFSHNQREPLKVAILSWMSGILFV